MSKIIGIDLGTTNSAVAIMENGQPKIIKDESCSSGPSATVPSVVGINPAGELVVGEEALNQYISSPENTIRSIKRKMGTDEKVTLAGEEKTPAEISAMILRYLKKMAEKYTGESIEKAVITVPAYFSDAQRQATKDAGEIAGLDVVRIINEPTAAALAYGVDKQENQHLLVYDLGGGTFDVSVIEKVEDVIEVRASHGNNHLGGDDFDKRLEEHAIKKFLEKHPKIDLTKDIKAMARLNRIVEEGKRTLSSEAFVGLYSEYITKKNIFSAVHLDMEIAREEFIALIDDLLQSTLESIEKSLKDAELTAEDIDKVLLVGGSTRIPAVWELIHKQLGKAPNRDINPDEAVALGAAVQAGIIAGEKISTVLVDVAPYSLGVEYAEFKAGKVIPGFYRSIVKRNTAIPTSVSDAFYTIHPDQDSVKVKVFQGDYTLASMNTFVGEFQFSNISAAEEKERPREIIVQFDYDVDGIIHVSAIDRRASRKEKGLTITESQIKLSEEEKSKAKEGIEKLEENTPQVEKLYKKSTKFLAKLKKDKREEKVVKEVEELVAKLETAKKDNKTDKDALNKLSELMYDYDFEG